MMYFVKYEEGNRMMRFLCDGKALNAEFRTLRVKKKLFARGEDGWVKYQVRPDLVMHVKRGSVDTALDFLCGKTA